LRQRYGAPGTFRMLVGIARTLTSNDIAGKSPHGKLHNAHGRRHDSRQDATGSDAIDKCRPRRRTGKRRIPRTVAPAASHRAWRWHPTASTNAGQAEDKDGIQDDDGCPETTSPTDAFPTTKTMPDSAGPAPSGTKKDTGCPRPDQGHRKTATSSYCTDRVRNRGRAVIKNRSFRSCGRVGP